MTKSRDLGNLAQTVAVNLPTALGTAGQTLVVNSGADGLEFGAAAGGSMTVYNDINGTDGTPSGYTYLTNASSPANGDLAFVTANNTVYVRAASGWRKIATVQEAPSAVTGHSASYPDIGQNPTTDITLSTTDPEGFDVTWSYVVGGNGTLSGSNINNSNGDTLASIAVQTANSNSGGTNTITYRITRETTSIAGDFTITFTATDSQSTGTSDTGAISFEIAFQIADSKYTTLLMATDGSAGNNQDDITDSSSNNHPITVYNDAHAGTFSPYRHGGYSTYFDGSGDYIDVGSAIVPTAYDTDYTIEMWIYPTTTGPREDIFNQYAATASGRMAININSDATISFFQNGLSPAETKSSAISANSWYHLAVVNSSGTRSFYVNGSLIGTATGTASMYSGNTEIGRLGDVGSNYFTGYITDVRVVNGSAITPASGGPTERLTTVSGTGYSTSLLTCHLPYIADGSSNNHSITVNGNTSTKPFGLYDYNEYSASDNGGSVYFDGTGDYLTYSHGALGSGNWTIEGWTYITSLASSGYIFDFRSNDSNAPAFAATPVDGWKYISGGTALITYSSVPKTNTWYHFAIVKNNGTTTMYINGSSGGTYTDTLTYVGNSAATIGKYHQSAAADLRGYISDLRVVEGTVVYSGAFTPPTGPLTTTGGTYPSTTNVNTSITASNTKLLLSGTDAHVLDKSQGANLKLGGTAAAVTNAPNNSNISSTNAVSFDGTGDYVLASAASTPSFGVGEFTIEGWIYMDNLSGNQIIVDRYASGNSQSFQLYYRSTGTSLTFYVGSSVLLQDPSSSTISAQTWHHIAVTRDGSNNVRLYVDGLKKAQSTSTVNFDSTIDLYLSARATSSTNYFNGYMQDVRLSNKAFYTADDESSNIPSAPLKG